jgi:hypothetical protein
MLIEWMLRLLESVDLVEGLLLGALLDPNSEGASSGSKIRTDFPGEVFFRPEDCSKAAVGRMGSRRRPPIAI